MANKMVLLKSIVEFLRSEFNTSEDEDQSESIEVAIQCIESAFNLGEFDHESYTAIPDLMQVFQANLPPPSSAEVQKRLAQAEALKSMGNEAMQLKKLKEAVDYYTKAIDLNNENPVYYCNRAAAHQNLGEYGAAVEDCKKAIALDSSYSKAYTRLGLAYINLEKHQEARDAYKKALELEPTNQHYINNLEMAEENLRNVNAPPASLANNFLQPHTLPSTLEHLNLNQFLNNPNFVNMATQMLANPEMQQIMQSLMSGSGPMEGTNISALVNAGQQLAQAMQDSNPDLVEELRRQIHPVDPQESSPAGDTKSPPPPRDDDTDNHN